MKAEDRQPARTFGGLFALLGMSLLIGAGVGHFTGPAVGLASALLAFGLFMYAAGIEPEGEA